MAIHDIPWDVTNFDAKPTGTTLIGQIDTEVRNTRQAARQRFKPEHNFDMANDDMQGKHKMGSARAWIGDADAPGYPTSPAPDYTDEETEDAGGRIFINLDTAEVSAHGNSTVGTDAWAKISTVAATANKGVVRDDDGFAFATKPIYNPGETDDTPAGALSTKGYVEERLEDGAPLFAIPIGFTYIQFPGCTAPATLWPSLTWSDISSNFAAGFLRVEGTYDANHIAAAFGSGAQLDQVGPHTHDVVEEAVANGAFAWEYFLQNTPGTGSKTTGGVTGSPVETRPLNYTIRVWVRTA